MDCGKMEGECAFEEGSKFTVFFLCLCIYVCLYMAIYTHIYMHTQTDEEEIKCKEARNTKI